MGNFFGAGRGGRHERGRVYIMRLPPATIQIGCTDGLLADRRRELEEEYGIRDLYVVRSFLVTDMGEGEDLARDAVIEAHQLQTIEGHDDLFTVPPGVTLNEIVETVEAALQNIIMENVFGAGRGGRHERGRVYIMRLPPEIIKIGCTGRSVTVRRRELEEEYGIRDLYVLRSFLVNDMGEGEDLAQAAVIEAHQLQRIEGHDDWFTVPPGVTLNEIVEIVEAALQNIIVR